jgi:hypothetical protein
MPASGKPSTSLFNDSSHHSFTDTVFNTGQYVIAPVVKLKFSGLNDAPNSWSAVRSPENPLLGAPANPTPRRRLLLGLSRFLGIKNEAPFINPGPEGEKREGIVRNSKSNSSSTVYKSDGLGVVCSLVVLEICPLMWPPSLQSSTEDPFMSPSQEPTKPETYILEMHKSGKGLAVWDPRPHCPHNANADEQGVVPGDVGTFSAHEGFSKLFNIFADAQAIRTSTRSQHVYIPPKPDTIYKKEALPLGYTFARGASANINFTLDGK